MRLTGPRDTIYAPATPAIRSAIAVIRVSGPQAGRALCDIAGGLPAPRLARLARLRVPATGEILDQALVLWFPGPHSETGEDMAEFQVHGGRAVVAGVLDSLASLPGFRLAQPGEFARRAFENGKLDLTAIEGIADLVAAETGAQRRLALRQLTGELDRLYEGWRARLMRALAHVEALIDFPEEGLPGDLAHNLLLDINALSVELRGHAEDRRGERVREGLAVAIVGPPNAGKSSLLNALVGRELAIVSALPGTTRDVIEAALDLDGFPVTLADTAGLRETDEAIEREGVRRALARAAAADLRLVVVDAGGDGLVPAMVEVSGGGRDIVVVSKIDLGGVVVPEMLRKCSAEVIGISVVTGAGLGELRARLVAAAREAMETGEAAVLTRARHREAVVAALEALVRCRTRLTTSGDNPGVELELLGEDLRLAVRSIGRITGRVDVEDMLDLVFRDFCIGK